MTEQLKDMKIRIKDNDHAKLVITCLEKLGYVSWCGNNTDYLHQVDAVYAYYDKDYVLSRNAAGYFEREEGTEVTLEQLQEMLAEQSAAENVPEDKFMPEATISTYMSQLQDLFKNAKVSVTVYGGEFLVCNMDNDDEVVVKDWTGVLEAVKAKQNYLSVFGK